LPNQFENAIDQTEIARQNIITSRAQKENVAIELQTNVNQAEISRDVIVNKAEAEANSNTRQNLAQMQSFFDVEKQRADAYAGLKTNLGLENEQLIDYIQAQVISDYKQDDLIVSIPSRK